MAIWKTEWGWRADFLLNGERQRAKGFFKLKSEARQWVQDEKKRLKENQQRFSSSGKDLALWTLAQKYLADCKVNFPKKTFDEKKSCLERFYKFAGDVSVVDITPPVVLDFVNDRAKTGSNNSANKDRKNLRAFYSWVQQMYGVLYDPTAPIKMKPHTKCLGQNKLTFSRQQFIVQIWEDRVPLNNHLGCLLFGYLFVALIMLSVPDSRNAQSGSGFCIAYEIECGLKADERLARPVL
jgi:hypothetical protein